MSLLHWKYALENVSNSPPSSLCQASNQRTNYLFFNKSTGKTTKSKWKQTCGAAQDSGTKANTGTRYRYQAMFQPWGNRPRNPWAETHSIPLARRAMPRGSRYNRSCSSYQCYQHTGTGIFSSSSSPSPSSSPSSERLPRAVAHLSAHDTFITSR